MDSVTAKPKDVYRQDVDTVIAESGYSPVKKTEEVNIQQYTESKFYNKPSDLTMSNRQSRPQSSGLKPSTLDVTRVDEGHGIQDSLMSPSAREKSQIEAKSQISARRLNNPSSKVLN